MKITHSLSSSSPSFSSDVLQPECCRTLHCGPSGSSLLRFHTIITPTRIGGELDGSRGLYLSSYFTPTFRVCQARRGPLGVKNVATAPKKGSSVATACRAARRSRAVRIHRRPSDVRIEPIATLRCVVLTLLDGAEKNRK